MITLVLVLRRSIENRSSVSIVLSNVNTVSNVSTASNSNIVSRVSSVSYVNIVSNVSDVSNISNACNVSIVNHVFQLKKKFYTLHTAYERPTSQAKDMDNSKCRLKQQMLLTENT